MTGNGNVNATPAAQSWYVGNDGNTHLWAEDPGPDGYRRVLRLSIYIAQAEGDPDPLPAVLIEMDRTNTPVVDLITTEPDPGHPWPASAFLTGPVLGYLANLLTETAGLQ